MALASYGDHSRVASELFRLAPKVLNCRLCNGYKFNFDFWVLNSRFFMSFKEEALLKTLIRKHGRENVAAGAQYVLESLVLSLIENLIAKYKPKSLCLGGGVFLNVKLNQLIRQRFPQILVYVPPNPADAGVAMGAALLAYRDKVGVVPKILGLPYLGLAFEDADVLGALLKYQKYLEWDVSSRISEIAAKAISDGKVVGWFQGREEWSPRALGNRSVFAHPGRVGIKDRINLLLKHREPFMPFGPSLLDEGATTLLDNGSLPSPYMKFLYNVKQSGRSSLAGVIHVDGTSRPQIVTRKDNPLLHELLLEFRHITGIPGVLNTSFNLHGLPLVHSPSDAISHLLAGAVDCLCIGRYFVVRAKGIRRRYLS